MQLFSFARSASSWLSLLFQVDLLRQCVGNGETKGEHGSSSTLAFSQQRGERDRKRRTTLLLQWRMHAGERERAVKTRRRQRELCVGGTVGEMNEGGRDDTRECKCAKGVEKP